MGYTDTVRILEECRTQTLSECWKDGGHRHCQNIGRMKDIDIVYTVRILEVCSTQTKAEYWKDGGKLQYWNICRMGDKDTVKILEGWMSQM